MTHKLHNQSGQPIEIYLPGEVLVLAAHASVEIAESAKSSAQLQVLLRTHQISLSETAGEEADAEEPEPEPKAPGRRKPEAKPKAAGRK